MNESYTYYAFVSHSHRDAKWAMWIQNALERYRLPSSVRKAVRRPLPKRLAPVFRDATDLGSCQLVEGLHRELEASRFLIVICSPDSAKPNAEGKHYVEHEVEYFSTLGRGDQIIPVIVRGTPEEAFCPSIRESGLLAIDATKTSRARVLNDIVARILGLRPDELWRREERRKKRRRNLVSSVCAVVSVLGLFAAGFVADRTWVFERCYSDYANDLGVPKGVGPVDRRTAEKEGGWAFEYRGRTGFFGGERILRRIRRLKSKGWWRDPRIWIERPDELTFLYAQDQQGRIVLTRTDLWGRGYGRYLSLVRTLASPDVVLFETGKERLRHVFRKSTTRLPLAWLADDREERSIPRRERPRSLVRSLKVSKGADGLVSRLDFLDDRGLSVEDCDGIGAILLRRDGFGRVIKMMFHSNWDTPAANADGIAGERFLYDENGVIRIEHLDVGGARAEDPTGVAAIDVASTNGTTVVERRDGANRFVEPDSAVPVTRYMFDVEGRLVSERYSDASGNAIVPSGMSASRIESRYGSANERLPGFQVYLTSTGCIACMTYEWDDHGALREWRLFDSRGVPKPFADGTTGGQISRADNGLVTNVCWLGATNASVRGCSVEYDERGGMRSLRYYGQDGCPAERDFDGRGVSGFNVTGNEFGDVLRCKIANDGEYLPGFVKGSSYKRNFNGLAEETRYLSGAFDSRVGGVDGAGLSLMKSKFDTHANRVSEEFLCHKYAAGSESLVTNAQLGVARVEWHQDSASGWIEELNFDAQRLTAANRAGYTKICRKRGRNGEGDGEERYWAGPNLVRVSRYDRLGLETNVQTCSFSDSLARECPSKIERWLRYDSLGHATSIVECVNKNVRELRCAYDANGFEIHRSFWDQSGKPITCGEGYHERRRATWRGRKVNIESYSDVVGKPAQRVLNGVRLWGVFLDYRSDEEAVMSRLCAGPGGKVDFQPPSSEQEWEAVEAIALECANAVPQKEARDLLFPDEGRSRVWRGPNNLMLTFLSDYGRHLGSCVHPGCVLVREYAADCGMRHLQVEEKRTFDELGRPQADCSGIWRTVTRRTVDFSCYQTSGFALSGRVIKRTMAYERRRTSEVLKDGTEKTTCEYFKEDGTSGWGFQGVAKDVIFWTKKPGHMMRETHTHYSPEAPGVSNVLHEVCYHDDKGRMSERLYFGKDDRPVCNGFGTARQTYEYDADGGRTIVSWARPGGCLGGVKGLFREVSRYNAKGRLVEDVCFDENGGPAHFGGQRYAHRICYTFGAMDQEIQEDRYRGQKDVRLFGADDDVWHIRLRKKGGKVLETLHYGQDEKLVRVVRGMD